ncbi:MAG TPA: glycosyltransferase [Candidatus Xenobia bacterium]|nr:glycosyltransferase [Candidatus Xenobia bacterium]
MAELEVLNVEAQQSLAKLGEADIVVGIPSYNNARTIGHVVQAVSAGLAKHFHERRAVIVNSDGGSKDGTQQVVLEAPLETENLLLLRHPLHPVQRITTPYVGLPGKGSAVRAIFRAAQRLKAKACAIVDSDLRSITPDWIDLLVRPVLLHDFDYVCPFYRRHRYDGTITNSIVYPLTRALYGTRVRQPIGGEFGLSARLVERLLSKNVWETDVARFGIDIWMTTTALAERFRVCQVFLGAKIHDPKDPGADLTAMLVQVVGSLFGLMEDYDKVWKETHGSVPTPMFGFRYTVGLEPVRVNPERMMEAFRSGVRDLSPVYESFLPRDLVAALQQLAQAPPDKFILEDSIWVAAIYDFAAAFHRRTIDRKHLLQSLTPLYLGWVASYVVRTQADSDDDAETKIEQLALVYEQLKTRVAERW